MSNQESINSTLDQSQSSVSVQYGLPEHVNVPRSSGEIQPGWSVSEVHSFAPNDGDPKLYATVTFTDPQLGEVYKTLPLDTLRALNPRVEDDDITVDANEIRAMRQATNGESDDNKQEVVSPEPIVEVIGVVAVRAEIPAPYDNAIAESQSEASRSVLTQQEREKLAVPESMSDAELRSKLLEDYDKVVTSLAWLFERQPVIDAARLSISRSDREIANMSDHDFGEISRFFEGSEYRTLTSLLSPNENGRGMTFADRQTRSHFSSMKQQLERIRHLWYTSTEVNRAKWGRNAVDVEVGRKFSNTTGSLLPEVISELSASKRNMADALELLGVKVAKETEEKLSEDPEYRNEFVAKWAERAKTLKDVSPDNTDLEQLIQEIEIDVLREAGRKDNPDSPSQWFGDRIFDTNQTKAREGIGYSGRKAGNNSSTRYVAELAADLLRGKFGGSSKSDSIKIDSRENPPSVEIGQHRAAALAMIYGKNWQKMAKNHDIHILIK